MWHSSTCYSVKFKPYNIVGNIYFMFYCSFEAHVLFVAKYHIIFSPRNVEIGLLIAVTFEFVHD